MKDEEKTREQIIEEMNTLREEIKALKDRLDIAERMNKVMANREFRIAELKKENKELKARIEELEGRLKPQGNFQQ